VGEDDQPGPILSLLQSRSFDAIYLLSTPNTETNTAGTITALGDVPGIRSLHVRLQDPTDYVAIFKHLRQITKDIVEQNPGSEYFVSVASGTPQMHACWVLLVSSGEFPASILHVRPPRFVTAQAPIVSEIDLTAPEFPVVRSNIVFPERVDSSPVNIQQAIQELNLVADHPKMESAINVAAALAPSRVPILLLGATGTGKELIAEFIHRASGRERDKFIAVNCAAIPKDLVESFLFGHKKGSFTGATQDQPGKFEQADGGTLFLDEIGDLPLNAQAKLLRVLQDGNVEALGSRRVRKVDVRVIAATNRNLNKAIRQHDFREDLYYRLNVGEIRLPTLNERRSDIPKIALNVLDRINTTLKRPKRLSPRALTRLQGQSWTGNVRDLQNVIERSVRLAVKDVIDADDLIISEPVLAEDSLNLLPEPSVGFSMEEFLSSARKQLVLRAVDASQGNYSEAARMLGISPQAVHKHMKNLHIHLLAQQKPFLIAAIIRSRTRRPIFLQWVSLISQSLNTTGGSTTLRCARAFLACRRSRMRSRSFRSTPFILLNCHCTILTSRLGTS